MLLYWPTQTLTIIRCFQIHKNFKRKFKEKNISGCIVKQNKYFQSIDIKIKNKVYVPATSAFSSKAFFFSFLPQPFTVLTRQTRQAVCAIKQSISLDVYSFNPSRGFFLQSFELLVNTFTDLPLNSTHTVKKCNHPWNKIAKTCWSFMPS
jgi:hypothetical protein